MTDTYVAEKIPSRENLLKKGDFLGYDGYDEVYLHKNKMYVTLDYLDKTGKLRYNVSRWYGDKSLLRAGYHEVTGEPL